MGRHSAEQADRAWVGLLEHMRYEDVKGRVPVPATMLVDLDAPRRRHAKPSLVADAWLRSSVWAWLLLGDLARVLGEVARPPATRVRFRVRRPRHRALVMTHANAYGRRSDAPGHLQRRLQSDRTRIVSDDASFPWFGAAGAVSRHVVAVLLVLALTMPVQHANLEDRHVLVQPR